MILFDIRRIIMLYYKHYAKPGACMILFNNQKKSDKYSELLLCNISSAIGEPDYMVDRDSIDDIFMCHESHRSVLFIQCKIVHGYLWVRTEAITM